MKGWRSENEVLWALFGDEVEETGLVGGLLDDILPDIKESLTWGMRFTVEISPFLEDSMFTDKLVPTYDLAYCLVAQEAHQDGNLHIHAILQCKKKKSKLPVLDSSTSIPSMGSCITRMSSRYDRQLNAENMLSNMESFRNGEISKVNLIP